uniref:Derlin n=1 Tax=Parascaris equorum TaxID=6256 RepID=A0A914R9F6_PAREQ
MADFGDWYRSVPEITRYWFTGTTVMPLLGRFGLFSPYYMLLEWHLFFYKFQVKYNFRTESKEKEQTSTFFCFGVSAYKFN